jgi:hypothetical protein
MSGHFPRVISQPLVYKEHTIPPGVRNPLPTIETNKY